MVRAMVGAAAPEVAKEAVFQECLAEVAVATGEEREEKGRVAGAPVCCRCWRSCWRRRRGWA